ncbi:MAG: hypothetical protein EZS28_001256 [Streblomastix strix]|uniref:Right handed beta helix domain-containing protein n=1 Tax=Streblomastix strix TaxID=222440 RepID=A0A5J4X7M6_9EUKA|nr:MAG: hypothetical protein EZS28_001256 [Streblomastix strix]
MEIELNNSQSRLIINNCNFINCEIDSSYENAPHGGALSIRLSNGAQTYISNSTFKECKAEFEGSGIYSDIFSGAKLTIDGQCQFIDCNRSGSGLLAGIFLPNAQLTLEDCIFRGCQINGGAVIFMFDYGVANLNKVIFENCSSRYGGGISLYPDSYQSRQVINGSTFNNCRATIGGGIYFEYNSNYTLEFINTTFFNCTAQYGGGLQYLLLYIVLWFWQEQSQACVLWYVFLNGVNAQENVFLVVVLAQENAVQDVVNAQQNVVLDVVNSQENVVLIAVQDVLIVVQNAVLIVIVNQANFTKSIYSSVQFKFFAVFNHSYSHQYIICLNMDLVSQQQLG